MAGTLTVDTIQSDSSYASTLNVASKVNFTSGMQVGGQDATFGGMRNRIINGNMSIDQRNAGAAVTVTNDANYYTTDRWQIVESSSCVLSAQQVTDAPSGFNNSLKLTVTTAAGSIGASETGFLLQRIEGFNTADLSFGTASASTITLSYWVKSSITGTFGGSLKNASSNRSYPFSYTIIAANTWEQKIVTIVGDTSGTWTGATNGIGIGLTFDIGSGSSRRGTASTWAASNFDGVTGATSIVTTLNATWQITGVQLEKGSAATAFENRQFGTELALCQRYYCGQNVTDDIIFGYLNGNNVVGRCGFPVTMRVAPTITIYSGGVANKTGQIGFGGRDVNGIGGTTTTGFRTLTNSAGAFGNSPYPWYEFSFIASSEL
jgi:hypothetical protein